MTPKMSRKGMLKFLENASKPVEEIGTTSADARKGKGQAVINLAEGLEITENDLVLKRGLDDLEDDGVVASKRRVDMVMEASMGMPDLPDDLFHQLLGSLVPQSSGSKSVWCPSFLLDQAPCDTFQSDSEMYKKLTLSQMAKVAETLSLRWASMMSFSVIDAFF